MQATTGNNRQQLQHLSAIRSQDLMQDIPSCLSDHFFLRILWWIYQHRIFSTEYRCRYFSSKCSDHYVCIGGVLCIYVNPILHHVPTPMLVCLFGIVSLFGLVYPFSLKTTDCAMCYPLSTCGWGLGISQVK